MLIVYGAYHFWPKRYAFRNDYCLSCRAPRRSVAVCTFDVGHVFWIPILPVGFWKHWTCSVCGRKPHTSRRTRRSFKWAGLLAITAVSVGFWAAPAETDPATIWMLRVLGPFGAILLLRHIVRSPKQRSLRKMLAEIQPAAETVCPFCSTPLVTGTGTRWSCPACGVLRY